MLVSLDFKNLFKGKDIGMKSFLECSEETAEKCKFSSHLETCCFFKWPLRNYIAKKPKKQNIENDAY